MSKQKSGLIKRILKDHFDGFWKLNAYRFPKSYQADIKETVEKAMRCGTTDLGYSRYECLGCEGTPKPVFVCFTCKSRFCHKCGKKYTDDWSDSQQEKIFDVPHRHMVFTIPKELRKVFFEDRKKLNELSKQVAQVFQYHYQKRSKKRNLTAGVITVIHTFGRDLKFNPHIHALVTEGALDNQNEWVRSEFIPYEYLRKSWQKVLLDLIKKWFPDNREASKLINDLYRRYPKGFYVNAERKMKNAKGAAKYIGRYLARPAIAEYRIEAYDGKIVRFWYEDHKTGKRVDETLPVYQFLFNLLQHICPKHFRMVQRFGLYSRRTYQKAMTVLSLYAFMRTKQLSLLLERKKRKKTYRQRMIEAFDQDPFLCPYCHRKMDLVEIWHADYGYLYHYMEDMECVKSRRPYKNDKKQRAG
ncbi:IS91 family transposase [Bacillus sp. V33-4]|uniref:IS91 family transposase n=1 Tax=Bacillus sp. V33-4 TaxID=2054169 RepID=UPI0015E10E42|nr:transposase [Bacillus sp. V33-4]